MSTDHVRYCVDNDLKRLSGYLDVLARPELGRRASMLLDDAADADAGEVIAVQTVEDNPNKIASVFAENGFLVARSAFVPYRSISTMHARFENKGSCAGTVLKLRDGSMVRLAFGRGEVKPRCDDRLLLSQSSSPRTDGARPPPALEGIAWSRRSLLPGNSSQSIIHLHESRVEKPLQLDAA